MRKPDIPRNKSPSTFLNMRHCPIALWKPSGAKCFVLFLIYPVYSLDSPDS